MVTTRTLSGLNLILPVLELSKVHYATRRPFRKKFAELREADGSFVERRIKLLHDLLQPVGAHHVTALDHFRDRILGQKPGIAPFAIVQLRRLREAGEAGVGVVLVAVLDEDVGTRFLNPHSDYVLAVFLELQDEARKVRVSCEQDVCADLRTYEYEFERVDRHADIGRVLFVAPVGRSEDQIDRRFGEGHDVLGIATPVGIGALYAHLAFDDVGIEETLQLL